MRKYTTMLGFLGIVLVSSAQSTAQNNIPSAVVSSFQQKFSNTTQVEWEVESNVYKVEFKSNGHEQEAWIDQSGRVISHKEELLISELPAAVTAGIERDFPGYRREDAEKLETDGKTTYKLDVKKAKEEWKVIYDTEGKLLSKVAD